MHSTIILTAFAATALANTVGTIGITSGTSGSSGLVSGTGNTGSASGLGRIGQTAVSCSNQVTGMQPGMGDQLVTIVQVSDANGTLKYFPDNIAAPVGSIVQFQFNPRNHTVTESSFDQPCRPLAANMSTPTRPGLRSGFVPVLNTDMDMKVFNVLINDTRPIWIFCGQAPHCQRGMNMVINQNPQDPFRTLERYRAAASQVAIPPGFPGAGAPPAPLANGAGVAGTDAGAGLNGVNTGATVPGTTIGGQQAQAASGTGSGTARFTGAASANSRPMKMAGIGGIVVAGLAMLL